MLDQAIRFGAILRQHEFERRGRILEVGSGQLGIGAFTEDPVTGVDLHFPAGATPGIQAMKASATSLPLRDGAFARVVCSDMLEHLPREERAAAIRELVRVTNGTLFLACPCGESARSVDGMLLRLYRFAGVHTPDWLKEHGEHGLPDADEVRAALQESGVRYREEAGESSAAHLAVSLLISVKILNNYWSRIFYRRAERAKRAAGRARFPGFSAYRRLWVVDCS